ncbi:Hpt domain-containing protein [Spirochaeta isovalerica]|uniref:HPt (Histidine-containing phosphotransfer) domain-containing protein n=1 Tax=Spirochaeta isovalerica TaxID=150 RepID=A0A841RAK0_9SPIO|nr:Hpt domain-containing protein [Spirochaeta isovalerica]MBB6480943.1 HPt (histidine-containing phosphotransfer) domain-containing protein [Spirochaeta isovalerica]
MKLLNLAEQAEDIGIDRSSLLSLYYIFINQTETDLKELKQLIAENNRSAIRDKAHHIKGASLNLEIEDMVESARLMVLNCDEGDISPICQELYLQLLTQFQNLKLQIAEEKDLD